MADEKKKKVLILEDHPGLRNLITEIFTLHGFEVDAVSDGQKGLTEAQKGGYYAIIADIKMPMMDGITFLRALQEHPPQEKNGPIIMYSNFAYEYSKDEVLALGASDFIAKDTLSYKELVDRVEEIVGNQQAE